MQIIISPAKSLKPEQAALPVTTQPAGIAKTSILAEYLKSMSDRELQELWQVNDKIAQKTIAWVRNFKPSTLGTRALETYNGQVFKSMQPTIFNDREWDYISNHLFIISGFYGAVRPIDGIQPYRLVMASPLDLNYKGKHYTSLYDFWGDDIYKTVTEHDNLILNLASKEYAKAVLDHRSNDVRIVTCDFADLVLDKKGHPKAKMKTMAAKIARGLMVRYLAENQIEDLEGVKKFNIDGYHFYPELSDDNHFIFIQKDLTK